MRGRVAKDLLAVCIVDENRLASEYLLGLLRKDRRIRPLLLEDSRTQSTVRNVNSVFLVDNCGLEAPLSQTLRNLRLQYRDAKFIVLDRAII